jgi:uracil-DNA glycosylase family 4
MEKAPGARCDECPLKEYKHALGSGPKVSSLAIVGEAPGAQEVAAGVPFTGRSGKLLDSVLRYHNINREEVWVTNVCLCRPPDNAIPPTAAIKACLPRLVAELQSKQPSTVLALGNTAAKTLLDTRTGITELRTETDARSPNLPGVRIIPTFHPAAALRQPDFFPSIVADIGKVNRAKLVWEHTKFKVVDNTQDAIATLRKQMEFSHPTIALDVELGMNDMKRIDSKRPDWLCIGISHRPGGSVVYTKNVVEDPAFQRKLQEALTSTLKRWSYQNGKFDIQHLWAFAPEARVDEDTMLLHYSTDERKGTHDLEQLAVEVLGAPRYKTDAKQYLPHKGASLAFLPPNVLYQYNAADVDVTHRLVDPLTAESKSDGTYDMYQRLLIPGSNALAHAEYAGVKVDMSMLRDLAIKFAHDLEEKEAELQRWVRNPRSPKQVKEALHELGIDVASTGKAILGELEHEFANKILDYRMVAKLLSTYVIGLAKTVTRSRIHPTFLLHGTETGRLSCRRPNLQNIPTGSTIRDVFTSGENTVLLNADYNQIEFRLLAVFSGAKWLLEQFRAGRHFHDEVAKSLYGTGYTGLQYLRAKAVNFGIPYGREAYSLWKEHGGALSDWQRYVHDWFAKNPEVKAYQRNIEERIKEDGYLTSYFGRKRRFWLVTQENKHEVIKEGYNCDLQGTASDLTLSSLIRLEPQLRGRAVPVITVHDNLLFEVRRDCLREVAGTVKEVMEDTPVKDICPTPVDIKVGDRWGSLQKYQVA